MWQSCYQKCWPWNIPHFTTTQNSKPQQPAQLILLFLAGREMSTGERAVMLCGWGLKARIMLRPLVDAQHAPVTAGKTAPSVVNVPYLQTVQSALQTNHNWKCVAKPRVFFNDICAWPLILFGCVCQPVINEYDDDDSIKTSKNPYQGFIPGPHWGFAPDPLCCPTKQNFVPAPLQKSKVVDGRHLEKLKKIWCIKKPYSDLISNDSNDLFLQPLVILGVTLILLPNPKRNFEVVNRRFQAKPASYSTFSIRETTAPIANKFCTT